jgi:methionyl-tRNA synthetase
MSFERADEDLKDVELCYKGLGIPFDSPPEEVDRAYRSISEKLKKELLSADPSKRSRAKEEEELVNNLYSKIKSSVNFQRKLRERSYSSDDGESTSARRTETHGPKLMLRICPSCNNAVNMANKVCPICRKRIYSSKLEKFFMGYLFSKNALLALVILTCLVLAIFITINFKGIINFFIS